MKFLVAVDGSEKSKDALRHAIRIARLDDVQVTAVHAVDPEVFTEGGVEEVGGISEADQRIILENVEDAEDRGDRILENIEEVAEREGYSIETEMLYGNPIEVVPRYAEETEFDNIFVGHRGMSEKTESLLGSVAKTLVERASVPVTVVR
ncbi:MAG: universal stress protein [Halobacteria archaeon]|nr:universal stress protein [Halobacteria archaeon]